MQLDFFEKKVPLEEDNLFLTSQIITYIGNKRSLLEFIGQGLNTVKNKLKKERISFFDVFSGSGIVSRYAKQHANKIIVNDLETYSRITNECYLANKSELNILEIEEWFEYLNSKLYTQENLRPGFISRLYAPQSLENIKPGERCFYTPRNAMYIDTARTLMDDIPNSIKHFFVAPLISQASIHANTSGVFKGFYKNSETGIGQFGGNNKDALIRILGEIKIKKPVFSRFHSEIMVCQGDANQVVDMVEDVDVAYIDPPYNQHPYGSNYFMLNLIANNTPPQSISEISGIPDNWNRSKYNKKKYSFFALKELVEKLKAKYILISFNSEGFINLSEMLKMLERIGRVSVLETKYNTFRGSRNLSNRDIHVKEYLYLVEKANV